MNEVPKPTLDALDKTNAVASVVAKTDDYRLIPMSVSCVVVAQRAAVAERPAFRGAWHGMAAERHRSLANLLVKHGYLYILPENEDAIKSHVLAQTSSHSVVVGGLCNGS